MTRVAVVVAVNPRNCGMYSVDLAALDFFSRRRIPADLFCPPYQRPVTRQGIGRLSTRPLKDFSDLAGYSHVAYWGDFTTNPTYGAADFAERVVRFSRIDSLAAGFEAWFAAHMPPPGRRPRVVSVGQSFQTLGDTPPELTRRAAERLAGGFDAIFPRDPASLAQLLEVAPGAANGDVRQGMDAAFLLREPVAQDIAGLPEQPYFTYFFHRSGLEGTDRLVDRLARETGLRPVPLTGWLQAGIDLIDETYRQNAARISGAAFVLSDTYHCCVNAWIRGTPAIGLGRAASAMEGTLGEYKKRVLFEMHGETRRYVELPRAELDATAQDRVLACAGALTGEGAWSSPMIEAQRTRFEAELAAFFAT